MDIYIDYETVCVNCKEKGYSFGYTFKTIEYKGIPIMDIPTRYLNGPCLTFDYRKVPIIIRSIENSHHLGVSAKTPLFTMINAKRNDNNSISRFTYLFSPEFHPEIAKITDTPTQPTPRIMEYVDLYRYEDKPYILLFYSYRNSTPEPLINFNFYNLYDFDIMGQDQFDTDKAEYDADLEVIYQYDNVPKLGESIYAGFGSTLSNHPIRFECNSSQNLMIEPERLNLRNINQFGPDDCATGLQWSKGMIGPGQLEVFPIMLVVGLGKDQFKKNVQMARDHLEKLLPSIYNAVNGKFRQLIDPELEKMSFSTKEWCKDE